MKAVVLASLICVSTVALGYEVPAGYAEGISKMVNTLEDAIHRPASRNFQPNAAACPWTCQETDFFLPAVQALTSCTAAQTALKTGLASATNSSLVDSAWTTFCASDCFIAAQQIQSKFYCCLGAVGGAFFGLNKGCAKNTATNRYCGAELLNIGGVQCTGTSEANCVGSGTSCEWDATGARCAFKPVAAVLNEICSPCIREYIEVFPSGGIESAASRNQLIAAYTTYCTTIQGNYCAITGGYDYQFRKADQLTNAELTDLCSDSDASVKKRLCYKQVQASVAASMRSGIQGAYALCLAQNNTASTCTLAAGQTAAAAIALDRMTDMMCTNKSASNYCFALESQAAFATPCASALITNNTCSGSCPTELAATAASVGCCLGAYTVSGSAVTASFNSMSRALSDSRALGFAGVLNRTAATPFIDLATFNYITNKEASYVSLSPLARLGSTCDITLVNDTSITSVNTTCFNPVPPAAVTLTIKLNVSAAALMDTTVAGFAKERLITDLANRLGITAASIGSVAFVATPGRTITTNVTGVTAVNAVVTLHVGSTAEVTMLKNEVTAQIAARSLSLPLLATELAVNCPDCLANTYSPVVDNSEVSVETTTAPGSPSTGGAAHQTLMVAATALLAVLAATI
jgi:hypothetical protein